MRFDDLKLIEPLLRAVHGEGYTEPTPIQVQAIPHVLTGRDLLGCAQTGTGKTAAFALPILQRLSAAQRPDRNIKVLVLAPTRELATQINDSFRAYGKYTGLKSAVIFGGVGQTPQIEAVKRGIDILVATPGRLLDLMGQGYIKLDRIEVLVLDEADRMLDMGFIHDVRRIIAAVPRQRQTLLFSATMPPEIQELANNILDNPEYVAVTPVASTVETIQQSVYFVEKRDKPALLEHILRDKSISRVLIFTRTKHGANKVVKQLASARIQGEAIHGNKSQTARERALANFKSGAIRVLVATDIAARGIDVDNITHVINYDLPNEPETYVHRIGRTARAGASGYAISFSDTEEREYLRDIERLIQLHIPRVTDHPYASPLPPPPMTDLTRRAGGGNRPQPRPSNGQNRGRQGQGNQGRRPQANNGSARTDRPTGQGGQNRPQGGGRTDQRPTGQAAASTGEGQGAGKRRRSRRRRRSGQAAPREVAN